MLYAPVFEQKVFKSLRSHTYATYCSIRHGIPRHPHAITLSISLVCEASCQIAIADLHRNSNDLLSSYTVVPLNENRTCQVDGGSLHSVSRTIAIEPVKSLISKAVVRS